jgi:hypothetical protein
MVFKKDLRKRRSDRLIFMIPLRVSGVTESGEAFECGGHAITVNRYGAHIRLERPVSVAHRIRLTNLENNLRGEFRIVRALENPPEGQSDYGVEAIGSYPSFWGISFSARPCKPGEARGLLECLQCRSVSLQPLSADEIEVLESGGTVKKPCTACRSKTSWKFAIESARLGGLFPKPEHQVSVEDAAVGQEAKAPQTVFVQRPVAIRTSAGQVETVQTENWSRGEIRCTSEKNYAANQVVTLEWENSDTGERLQVQGRVRLRHSISGSQRMIYSIRYEGSPVTLPPVPLKPAGKLYGVMGALVAAASFLVASSARGLAFSIQIPSGAAARLVVSLGVVLLLLSVAYKCWSHILGREPENRRPFRKRHVIAGSLLAVVFLGSLAAGAVDGVVAARQSEKAQLFLHHLAMARIFEKNIDAAENRVMSAPADYADDCATLRLLAGQWQNQLEALSAVAGEIFHGRLWRNAKFQGDLNGLEEIMTLDQRKLHLVQQQIALETEAQSIDPDKQPAFWQARFPPLRQKILELDAQKSQVAKTLMAKE